MLSKVLKVRLYAKLLVIGVLTIFLLIVIYANFYASSFVGEAEPVASNNAIIFSFKDEDTPFREGFLTHSCFYKQWCLIDLAQKDLNTSFNSDKAYISIEFSPSIIDSLFLKRDIFFFRKTFHSAYVSFGVEPHKDDMPLYSPKFVDREKTTGIVFNSFDGQKLSGVIYGFADSVKYNMGGIKSGCIVMDGPAPEECYRVVEINRPYVINFNLTITQY